MYRISKCQNFRLPGFTLIELLVVIAIIALLLSILIPALGKGKDLVRDAMCMSNLRQISIAMRTYAQNNKDFYPANAGGVTPGGVSLLWCLAYAPYVGEGDIRSAADLCRMGGIKIYNCPKYPDKTQLIDLVTNDWDDSTAAPHNGVTRAKITDFKNPGTKVYMTDYETHNGFAAADVRSSAANRFSVPADFMAGPLAGLDVFAPIDLPCIFVGNPPVTLPDVPPVGGDGTYSTPWVSGNRRVALNRHKKWGAMVSYHDGHSGWLSWKDHKAELYNRK